MNTDLRINDTWFSIEAKAEGKPVLMRGRQALHNLAESGLFNHRIDISWDFTEPTTYGLPTPEENKLMAEVEDALTDVFEVDVLAALALVHTQDNVRSWMFYTRSVSEFSARLNQALSKFKRLPISLERNDDPDWDLYHDVLTSHDLKEN